MSASIEMIPKKIMQDSHASVSALPKLLIAAPAFGLSGQPWLWRQVVGLQSFRRQVLCWTRMNPHLYSADDIPVTVLGGDPAPYNGAGRWWLRLQNLWGGNFFAARGAERRDLDELLRESRPAAILCYFGEIAMRLLPVAQRHKIPVIAYFHGDFQFLTNRWYRWSLLKSLHEFAAIAVVTEAEHRWMLANGVPASKLRIVPCGVPTVDFHPRPKVQGGPIKFVMVSRLSPEKGCANSISAFARLAGEIKDSQLHVYGDGPDREQLHRLVETLGLAERITFHGYVGERELAEVLPSYDIFIQHSLRKEGSPVSIAEAMACAIPVVATPIGGIPDQVLDGQTGFLVPPGDTEQMVSVMKKLATDESLRRTMGEAGRARAIQLYDSAALATRLGQVVLDATDPA
jgi:glycosyltransferase involved in cell wall biosynthesis